MTNIVGIKKGKNEGAAQLAADAEREQLFENVLKPALLDSSPFHQAVSPLKVKDFVCKIPMARKNIHKELNLVRMQNESDPITLCQRWREVRRNYVSIKTSRKILEVGYVEKNPNKKRKVLVPSSSESESGLIIKDKKCTLTYNSEKFVRD